MRDYTVAFEYLVLKSPDLWMYQALGRLVWLTPHCCVHPQQRTWVPEVLDAALVSCLVSAGAAVTQMEKNDQKTLLRPSLKSQVTAEGASSVCLAPFSLWRVQHHHQCVSRGIQTYQRAVVLLVPAVFRQLLLLLFLLLSLLLHQL